MPRGNLFNLIFFFLSFSYFFSRHYGSNRAPLSLSFDAAWLKINKGFTKVLADWIQEKLSSQSDVYFVTELQVRGEGFPSSQQNIVIFMPSSAFYRNRNATF